MRSSLPSGKSSTPPARCIHRPRRDTSSAEYRLLVSLASCGASRELSSRRSPALIPHTCAVSPTFRYGAFLFVALALADSWSARLTAPRIPRSEAESPKASSMRGANPPRPTLPPSANRSPRPCRIPVRLPASARRPHRPPSPAPPRSAASAPQSSPPNPPRSKAPARP